VEREGEREREINIYTQPWPKGGEGQDRETKYNVKNEQGPTGIQETSAIRRNHGSIV